MTKSPALCVAILLCVVGVGGVMVGGCGGGARSGGPAAIGAVGEPSVPMEFEDSFLEAGRAYSKWQRGFYSLRMAQMECRALSPEEWRARRAPMMSASEDEATHGQKVFWLYAKDGAYQEALAFEAQRGLTAPVGQVLVKQAWSVKRVDASWVSEGENRAKCAQQDGAWFAADEPRELFIMMKKAKSVQGTDGGWVYGVVTADGSKVVRSGLLQDCMGCHKAAKHDRQLGFDQRRK